MTLRMFVGNRTIHKFYGDRSEEISKALKTIGIMQQGSQPGAPQTNAVVERGKGDAERDHCFWLRVSLTIFGSTPCVAIAYLMIYVALTMRAKTLGVVPTGGTSKARWCRLEVRSFFKPTTDRTRKHKFEDPAIVSVFAGSEMTTGYGWSGIYLIWRLEDFVNIAIVTTLSCHKPTTVGTIPCEGIGTG